MSFGRKKQVFRGAVSRGDVSLQIIMLVGLLGSPDVSGQYQSESAKLVAADAAERDAFGISVSVSGDVAIVGATGDDDNGLDSGSVYVFRRDPGGPGPWIQEQKLLASDGEAEDRFGDSVAVSGDVAVVGTRWHADGGGLPGAVYVYRWHPGAPGSWIEEQELLASDAAPGDLFGRSVSISADVIVVGASGDDDLGSQSGSAYVFRWTPGSPGSWLEEQKLLPSDGEQGDNFGSSVSVAGDVAVVGASFDQDNGFASGSAYVFRWDGLTWRQEQKLLASDGALGDSFGMSLGVSGNIAVVGAPGDGDSGYQSGSAYVFRWTGLSWVEEQKLLSSDGAALDSLGYSVSVSGDVVLVGGVDEDDNGTDSGAAYVFRWNPGDPGSWVQDRKLLASDGISYDAFGECVSVSGDVALIGAMGVDVSGPFTGSAYAFQLAEDSVACLTNAHCDDADVCTRNQCQSEVCVFEDDGFGDLDGNGSITLADIFCVLDGFAGQFSTCSRGQVDIHGSCGGGPECCPNGVLNILDVFAVLDAYQGEDPCCGGPP